MHQLVAASCLLLVLGGLLPFAAPEGRRAMAHEAPNCRSLRGGSSAPARWRPA